MLMAKSKAADDSVSKAHDCMSIRVQRFRENLGNIISGMVPHNTRISADSGHSSTYAETRFKFLIQGGNPEVKIICDPRLR